MTKEDTHYCLLFLAPITIVLHFSKWCQPSLFLLRCSFDCTVDKNLGKTMGNFCMGDVGINGIADRKHEKPPKGLHFRPRARRARGRKWGPVGGFSCLRSAIPFTPKSPMQKLHLYLGLYDFWINIQEIIIPEKLVHKTFSKPIYPRPVLN